MKYYVKGHVIFNLLYLCLKFKTVCDVVLTNDVAVILNRL